MNVAYIRPKGGLSAGNLPATATRHQLNILQTPLPHSVGTDILGKSHPQLIGDGMRLAVLYCVLSLAQHIFSKARTE